MVRSSIPTGSILYNTVLLYTIVLLYAQYSMLQVQGVPLDEFFEFNFSSPDVAGETLFLSEDDKNHPFNLNLPFLFYDQSYTQINVNTNGILGFDDEDMKYTPMELPQSVPVIVPYWADVDTRGTGHIWVRNTNTDTAAIDRVKSLVAIHFEDNSRLHGYTEIIVVTWYRVGYYKNQTNKVNTFQCVVASDGINTFAIFLYLDDGINWTTGDANGGTDGLGGTQAQAGFDAGNQINFRIIEGSFSTDDIINIEKKSNVGVPGMFIFQINGFIRAANEGPCPTVGRSGCKERLVQAACSYLKNSKGSDKIPLICHQQD